MTLPVTQVASLGLRLLRDNRTWGAGRIRGELLKLGFCVATSTIQIYISRFRSTPTGQRWSTFLKNQADGISWCRKTRSVGAEDGNPPSARRRPSESREDEHGIAVVPVV